MKKMHVATVQILIDIDNWAEACDAVSETFRQIDWMKDWSYLKVGAQLLGPYEKYVSDKYEEGDFF